MQPVKYTDIRDKIETGDVYFTASPTIIGKTIRGIRRANVSHVGVFKVSDRRLTILEAQMGDTIDEEYASKVFANIPIYYISTKKYRKANKITKKDILDKFEAYVGEKYDTAGLFLGTIKKSKGLFCSKMTADILRIPCEHLRREYAPDDLYPILKSHE